MMGVLVAVADGGSGRRTAVAVGGGWQWRMAVAGGGGGGSDMWQVTCDKWMEKNHHSSSSDSYRTSTVWVYRSVLPTQTSTQNIASKQDCR